MSGRPALIRSRDVKQVILATKKAGANRVEVPIGKTSVIVHLSKSGEADNASADKNEWDGAV